jgi:hypothetical protein
MAIIFLIRDILGSNLIQETGWSNWGSSWIYSIFPDKFRISTSN